MSPEEDGGPSDGTAFDYEALSGIADDLELGEMTAQLAPLYPKHNTFPGDVLLELAADAIEEVQLDSDRSSSKASANATFSRTGLTRWPSTTRPSMRSGRRR